MLQTMKVALFLDARGDARKAVEGVAAAAQ
jgi:hypothetical protein